MRSISGVFGSLTRLVLVFSLDLEDVEEICGGGMDLDEVLVWLGDGVGELCDLELAGALRVRLLVRGFLVAVK